MFSWKEIRSERGVTLVEALVAAGLLSFIALSSLTYLRNVSAVSHHEVTACRINNNSILNRIRSMGVASQIATFIPLAGSDTVTSSKFPNFSTLVSDSLRWPGGRPIATATDTYPIVNNYLLYNGYMTYLQAMYKNIPGVCGTDSSTSVSLIKSQFSDLVFTDTDASKLKLDIQDVKIQIRPYNIDTGAMPGCSALQSTDQIAPKGIYPEGDPSSPLTGDATHKKATRNNVVTNLGYAVSITTTFKTPDDKISGATAPNTCFTEQLFQYPSDTSPPPKPTLSFNNNNPFPAAAECSDATANSLTLTVEMDNSPTTKKPGTVLLCKDDSFTPDINASAPFAPVPAPSGVSMMPQKQFCYKTDGNAKIPDLPGPQVSINNEASNYYPTVGYNGFSFAAGTQDGSKSGPSRWVSCASLTVCGKGPDTVAPFNGDQFSGSGYTITYTGLPADCRIRLTATSLDPAGNEAKLAEIHGGYTDFSPVSNLSYDVPRPRCHIYCGDTWPNGYYTCRPSC